MESNERQDSRAPSRASDAAEQVPAGSAQSGENTCRRCAGRGRVDGKPCSECAGTGKIITLVGDA
jgi:DnaJ-class molecular chaperone